MQLRLVPFVARASGCGFKHSTSAILSGITIAGAFSTVIFGTTKVSGQVNGAFQTLFKALENTPLYDGAKSLATTFKDWGAFVVGKKDDFKEWVRNYLNPQGFKSGAVELYNKLYDWGLIVYNWFATKFLEFLRNIPKIVENWRRIRLSLFKWGTFLGGGGGSAIWGAMFGSGDSWAKLGDLMGHPNFEEMMSDFNKLVENNQKAFEEMGEEGIRDIIEQYLENPEEAQKAAKELLKEQEKKEESEEEEGKLSELKAEEILEEFSGQKGGKPQSPPAVLTQMVQKGLSNLPYSSFEAISSEKVKEKAVSSMNEYISKIEDYSNRRTNKSAQAQKEFLDIIKDQKEAFVSALADDIVEAHKKAPDLSKLNEEFIKALESKVTEICTSGECENVDLSKVLKE